MSQTSGALCAVILAAGEGKRMHSAKPKVMLEVLLKPMLGWVIDAARSSGISDLCVVTGYGEEVVKGFLCEYVGDAAETVTQKERKGTGHAVMQARRFLERHAGGQVLVACGDAPFLDTDTISSALRLHTEQGNAVTVISASLDNPFGYGRIIRSANGAVSAIVEQKEGTQEQLAINEVNSGAYWFNIDALLSVLDTEHLPASAVTGEHYLPDAVAALIGKGLNAGAYQASTTDVVLGANDPVQLYELGQTAREHIISGHISNGVSMPCTDSVIIGPDVTIGAGTVVLPGCILTGKTAVGSGCVIGPNTSLTGVTVGDSVKLNNTQAQDCRVLDGCDIGPFTSIRPGCVINSGVRLGSFVEVKNSSVGSGSSVAHLSYIGDSDIGEGVNVGCGCATANFDGRVKERCSIGDGAFIGCHTSLVAPVNLGAGVYTAAGSVITEDVPEDALAISRGKQVNKKGGAKGRFRNSK